MSAVVIGFTSYVLLERETVSGWEAIGAFPRAGLSSGLKFDSLKSMSISDDMSEAVPMAYVQDKGFVRHKSCGNTKPFPARYGYINGQKLRATYWCIPKPGAFEYMKDSDRLCRKLSHGDRVKNKLSGVERVFLGVKGDNVELGGGEEGYSPFVCVVFFDEYWVKA